MYIPQLLRTSLVVLSIIGCVQTVAREGERKLFPPTEPNEEKSELRRNSAVVDACTISLANKADLRAGYDPKAGVGLFLRF